jgi:hypothetical protein
MCVGQRKSGQTHPFDQELDPAFVNTFTIAALPRGH